MTEKITPTDHKIPVIQRIIAVIWPSFLVAGIESIIFFTFFDPQFVFYEYDVTRVGAYSIGFFLFWGFTILACTLTMYFTRPCRPGIGQSDDQSTED